jgi:hypothetical protein
MKKILLGLTCGIFWGCGLVPHKADFITERSEFKKADLVSNGILAFHSNQNPGVDVDVDFDNKAINQKFRIDFTPGFYNILYLGVGPIKVAEKKLDKIMVSDSIALFSLPPGKYQPWYLYAKRGNKGGKFSVKGEGFEIRPGEITSVGKIEIKYDEGLFGFKSVTVQSNPGSISDEIKLISERNLNKMVIQESPIIIEKK